jgi:hypothetical protein
MTSEALIERLQVDLNTAAVERGVSAVDTDERGKALDGGILEDNIRQGALPSGHGGERYILRRFGYAKNHASILHREKSFGHVNVKQDCPDQRANRDQKCGGAIAQHELERTAIESDDIIKDFFRLAVEPGLLVFRLVTQKLRAHHRSQGERDGRRDQDGHR